MGHEFLSSEWISRREGHPGRVCDADAGGGCPSAASEPAGHGRARVRGGDGVVHAHADTGGPTLALDTGALTDPDLTVTVDYDTAYDLLVEQKPNAAIGAFLSGRIRLAGDMERLAGQTGFDPSSIPALLANLGITGTSLADRRRSGRRRDRREDPRTHRLTRSCGALAGSPSGHPGRLEHPGATEERRDKDRDHHRLHPPGPARRGDRPVGRCGRPAAAGRRLRPDRPDRRRPSPARRAAAPGDGRTPEHEHTRRWAKTVAVYDGFVLVTPEYNHSPAGALKNALDFLFAEWNDKAAGFVSYGSAGGVRAVEHLRQIVGELKMADIRAAVALQFGSDFDATFAFRPREFQEQSLHAMLDDLVAWSTALPAGRTPVPVSAPSRNRRKCSTARWSAESSVRSACRDRPNKGSDEAVETSDGDGQFGAFRGRQMDQATELRRAYATLGITDSATLEEARAAYSTWSMLLTELAVVVDGSAPN